MEWISTQLLYFQKLIHYEYFYVPFVPNCFNIFNSRLRNLYRCLSKGFVEDRVQSQTFLKCFCTQIWNSMNGHGETKDTTKLLLNTTLNVSCWTNLITVWSVSVCSKMYVENCEIKNFVVTSSGIPWRNYIFYVIWQPFSFVIQK